MRYLTALTSFLENLTNPYPARDWYGALIVSGLVLVVLGGVAVYLFFGIQSGFIIVPKESSEVIGPTVSREKLQNVLDTYTERTVNFEARNYPAATVADPAR